MVSWMEVYFNPEIQLSSLASSLCSFPVLSRPFLLYVVDLISVIKDVYYNRINFNGNLATLGQSLYRRGNSVQIESGLQNVIIKYLLRIVSPCEAAWCERQKTRMCLMLTVGPLGSISC